MCRDNLVTHLELLAGACACDQHQIPLSLFVALNMKLISNYVLMIINVQYIETPTAGSNHVKCKWRVPVGHHNKNYYANMIERYNVSKLIFIML